MIRKVYKRHIFHCLVIYCLFSGITSFAQGPFPDREFKIEQLKLHSEIKVTEFEPGILQLRYHDGETKIKNTNELERSPDKAIKYSTTFDSTIIDLRTLDTIPFYKKYSFWQEVEAGSPYTDPPLVGDINHNGSPEIYGIIQDYGYDNSDVTIMEKDSYGIFDSVFTYDRMSNSRAMYDVNKDGLLEVPLRRYPSDTLFPGHAWCFFTQPTASSFANDLSFVFYPFATYDNQLNNNRFGDWDGDGITDQVFIRLSPLNFYVYEYNGLNNNFDSVYFHDLFQYGNFFSGFAIGDFNQNGKTEFLEGGVNGEVVSIENCGNNCYHPIYSGYIETNNAYLFAGTNDIDGNGKPEVWIGGDFFLNGIGYTRITILEADGENNYEAVGKIDLIGVFSFYASNMQVMDVDKDGKPEIMVCIDEYVIILKFTGSTSHQTYAIFYLKCNDLLLAGRDSEFYGATMYDVTGDDDEDIIIYMDDIIHNLGIKLFTFIYKSDFMVSVKEADNIPQCFELYQNYPNPFNPSTNIKFQIHERSDVTLKVYNILGKEIITLLDEQLSPGSFTIDWAAKDGNGQLLPSGIYLISLSAVNTKSSYLNTIKTVLVK